MDEKWVEIVMDILANLIVTSYQQEYQKEEVSQQKDDKSQQRYR